MFNLYNSFILLILVLLLFCQPFLWQTDFCCSLLMMHALMPTLWTCIKARMALSSCLILRNYGTKLNCNFCF